jgi:hypothetical protein
MKNVTAVIREYAEARRHLWNTSFSRMNDPLKFGAALEIYEDIDALLFKALVCEQSGLRCGTWSPGEPVPGLLVRPHTFTEVPILINRSVPASGYWDHPIKYVLPHEVELKYIGFFDWDEYTYMDCRYYRVRISTSLSLPELAGRDALVETSYADVVLGPEALEKGRT